MTTTTFYEDDETEGYAEAEVVDMLAMLLDGDDLELATDASVGVNVENVQTLSEGGYMTRDVGLEVRLADGRTFLLTVKEKR